MKAFPLSNMTGLNQSGMDLRDYFAAMAMIGELIRDKNAGLLVVAEDAYMMADAMMKARGE